MFEGLGDSLGSREEWLVNTSPAWWGGGPAEAEPVVIPFDSFDKYLLSTCYIPGALLGAGDMTVNTTDKNHCLRRAEFLVLCCDPIHWLWALGVKVSRS